MAKLSEEQLKRLEEITKRVMSPHVPEEKLRVGPQRGVQFIRLQDVKSKREDCDIDIRLADDAPGRAPALARFVSNAAPDIRFLLSLLDSHGSGDESKVERLGKLLEECELDLHPQEVPESKYEAAAQLLTMDITAHVCPTMPAPVQHQVSASLAAKLERLFRWASKKPSKNLYVRAADEVSFFVVKSGATKDAWAAMKGDAKLECVGRWAKLVEIATLAVLTGSVAKASGA